MAHIGSCKMQDLRLNPAVPGYGKAPWRGGTGWIPACAAEHPSEVPLVLD